MEEVKCEIKMFVLVTSLSNFVPIFFGNQAREKIVKREKFAQMTDQFTSRHTTTDRGDTTCF